MYSSTDIIHAVTMGNVKDLDTGTIISGLTGWVSIACWIAVFSPQVYKNFKRQSAEGLKLTFINLWLIGSVFNFIGGVLQGVLSTMIILAAYYTLAGLVLLIQSLAYSNRTTEEAYDGDTQDSGSYSRLNNSDEENRHHHYGTTSNQRFHQEYVNTVSAHDEEHEGFMDLEKPETSPLKEFAYNSLIVINVIICGMGAWWVSVSTGDTSGGSDGGDDGPRQIVISGQVFGWLCAGCYIASRITQLWLNYKSKSVKGVSLLFFVFSCLGNLTYCASILSSGLDKRDLIINSSWLIGAGGVLLLDSTMFIQFWKYS